MRKFLREVLVFLLQVLALLLMLFGFVLFCGLLEWLVRRPWGIVVILAAYIFLAVKLSEYD